MKKTLGLILIALGTITLLSATTLPGLAGFGGQKRYLILLQNQMELRPTGGFLGSYAVAKVKNGKLVEVSVQDIYEPDGRVTEYIEPPAPIQEAFNLGTLRLRDANWDPDFPSAAKTLLWYFDKAGEGEFDGMIATNLLVFQEALKVLGPIKLIDYDEEVTADNLWEKAQFYSQEGFFPGSKQKQEFLGDLSKSLIDRLKNSSFIEKIRLIKLTVNLLAQKQIMVYSSDGKIQSGQVKTASCPAWLANCVANSLMVVEANLGVNKANCCIDRNAQLELKKQENGWHHQLTLTYQNRAVNSPWSGEYRAWVRVLIPSSAGGEKSFWVKVPPGKTRKYQIEYFLPAADISQPIYLTLQKQSGIEVWPITINGRELKVKQDLRLWLR